MKRFWSKVRRGQPDECWPWQAGADEHGYGIFNLDGRTERAHRVAFFLTHGRWPEPCGLHRCDAPPCCNPAHVFEGTRADNVRDMDRKGRRRHAWGDANGSRRHLERRPRGDDHFARRCPGVRRGERNGRAKLTKADARIVWALVRWSGFKQTDVAREFGVSQTCVSRTARRVTWQDICT